MLVVPAEMGHDGHHHGPRNSKVQALGEVSVQLENATGISSNVTKCDRHFQQRHTQLLRQHTKVLRAQLLRAKHKEQMLLESLDRAQQEIAQSCGRGLARYSQLT